MDDSKQGATLSRVWGFEKDNRKAAKEDRERAKKERARAKTILREAGFADSPDEDTISAVSWMKYLALAATPLPALKAGPALGETPTFAEWLDKRFPWGDGRATAKVNANANAAAQPLLQIAHKYAAPRRDGTVLIRSALAACFAAAGYWKPADGWATNRPVRKRFDKDRASIQAAARNLAAALATYPDRLGFALPPDYSIRRRSGAADQNMTANLQFLLQKLADNIGDLTARPAGATLPTVVFACLLLQPSSKVPDVQTALLFHLAFIFRRWTSGQPLFGGPPCMPTEGQPCWPVAAALAAGSLLTAADARKAQHLVTSLIKGHDRVILLPWPNLI